MTLGLPMHLSRPLYRFDTVRRILLDKELERQFGRLQERNVDTLLDIGAKNSPYEQDLPCRRYMTLDIDPASEPDILCDVHEIEWESDYFDAIIATEVLEHLYDPQQAVDQFHRILKPGGVCILSVPFLYEYHPDPYDYYRYTKDSLDHLCRSFSRTEVYSHGNRLQAIWLLFSGSNKTLGLVSWLNPAIARMGGEGESRCPLGHVVWSVK